MPIYVGISECLLYTRAQHKYNLFFIHGTMATTYAPDICCTCQPPKAFYCPLSQKIMTDAVVDVEGYSFDRRAIEDWVVSCNASPITRNPLTIFDLRPNLALRQAISEFFQAHQLQTVQTSTNFNTSLQSSSQPTFNTSDPSSTEVSFVKFPAIKIEAYTNEITSINCCGYSVMIAR